ncbi:nitrophenyl compound nitroreductase subunit ArsF family protein [Methanocella sp. MCL-LM]|uniref:nitrophenyl compound nitroreductase subunit ArsF family protein n=1 Tax=Methanocella sp. MCL-LM TaxID=3412035 RepID=UPI003C712863
MKSAWKMGLLAITASMLIIVVAIAFGLVQVGFVTPAADQPAAAIVESVDAGSGPGIVELLYFHRTDRCTSCNNAEQYARETLDQYYKDEVESGEISIRSIDYQQDKATADKYNVKVQGLKIRTAAGGQENVKDVPEIWSYVSDRDAYVKYLKSVIDKELGG